MQITQVSPPSAGIPSVHNASRESASQIQKQSGPKQETAILSQKAKDLAAQKSGKTMQEEAGESPVVEANEEKSQK